MAKSARSGVVKAVGVEKGSSPLSGAARRARAGLVRSVGHSGRVDSGVVDVGGNCRCEVERILFEVRRCRHEETMKDEDSDVSQVVGASLHWRKAIQPWGYGQVAALICTCLGSWCGTQNG